MSNRRESVCSNRNCYVCYHHPNSLLLLSRGKKIGATTTTRCAKNRKKHVCVIFLFAVEMISPLKQEVKQIPRQDSLREASKCSMRDVRSGKRGRQRERREREIHLERKSVTDERGMIPLEEMIL